MLSRGLLPDATRARLEAAVAAAESSSAAELVVVLAPRAEDYRAEALLVGMVTAFGALLVVALAPPAVPLAPGLLAVAGAAALATRLTSRAPRLLRRLVPAARRRQLLRRLAKVVAHDQALTGTRDRTGLLVLYGDLEQDLVLLGDVGVLRTLGAGPLLAEEDDFRRRVGPPASRLEQTLARLGPRLAAALPAAPDDRDELPNRVQVLAAP